MATAGDGVAPYQSGGAGGKFRKRPIRRSTQATPYDRPPIALRNNRPSLFGKLVDPASRLIYAGADRLFGVFRKRLPSIPAQRPPEINEGPTNGLQEAGPNDCTVVSEPSTDEGGNLASMSAATEILELENMLKQKTFTRSEIEHLTALLRSRTNKSDVDEGYMPKLPIKTSHLLKLEASTSGPLNKHVEERENLHASTSTLVVNSRAFEEDVASPAELAKAYMGTRPSKVLSSTLRLGSQAPRQDSGLLNNTTILPRTPITSLAPRTSGGFKGLENSQTTPRSRGRSAIYTMARTPYHRGIKSDYGHGMGITGVSSQTSSLSQKGIKSDYGHGMGSPSRTFSLPSWEHEGSIESSKMALKRRSSVLDDIESGGPVRRIRQKANLLMQGSSLSKNRSEFHSSAYQQPGAASQKLLLRNEPEPKTSKAVDENGVTSRHSLGYASVPTKSTQMASKILEQLERLSPKEKSSGSRLAGMNEKSPTKLTPDIIHGQALGRLEKVDSPKFLLGSEDIKNSEGQHVWLSDVRESTSQSKDRVEENGPRKFAVPRNVLNSNGNLTSPVRENPPIVTNTDSTLKLTAEPQKKRSFQMSAPEDSLELDDDIQLNGHVSIPLDENKKSGTSVFGNKDVSANEPTKVVQTPSLAEVYKIPGMSEFKKSDDATSPPNSQAGPPGGSVNKQIKFNLPTSPPSSSNQLAALSQSTLVVDRIVPPKEPRVLPTFGTSTRNVEEVQSFGSANEPSGFKASTSPVAKPLGSTSLFNSVKKNDQVQISASNKDDDKCEKSLNMVGKLESSSSASPTMASTSGNFSFGGSTKNSSITNGTPALTPPVFVSSSPFPAATNTTKLHAFSSGTTAASLPSIISTTSASSSVFPASAPAFSFGSAIASSTSVLVAQASETSATIDKVPASVNTSSPFASTSFATLSTGGGIIGFSSSPAGTSPTKDHSQENIQASTALTRTGPFKFGTSSTSVASGITQASTVLTQTAPFKFGTSSTAVASGTTAIPSTSGSSLFGSSSPAFSSTPSFGFSSSSAISSSEIKFGSSTSSSASNKLSSAFSSTPSFGLGSVAASETKSCNSTSSSTTNIFGSDWQAPKSSVFGSPSTVFSFGASSASMPSASSSPIVFGSSSAGASTGSSSLFSFTAAGATNPSFAPVQSVFGNSTPVFGSATASPSNNDQMSMEDSMAEDNTQTPSSSVPAFGQTPAGKPGFMFGSATSTASAVPFQFGGQMNQPPTQNPFQASGSGQTNQPPSQNPFQASGSAEFNAGGSFSLGSGGGDKSGRRILRVKSKNRRK